MTSVVGSTTAVPRQAAEIGEVSVPAQSTVSEGQKVEPPKIIGIRWQEVLSGQTSDQMRLRERGKKEAPVSPEVFQRVEEGLVEAALVYAKGLKADGQPDSDKVGNLAELGEILKKINPDLNFADVSAVQAAVRELIKRYPAQAVALGIVYQEIKFSALSKAYDFHREEISALEPGVPATVSKSNEVIINPDGTLVFQEKVMEYEEFIKTPAGQKERRGVLKLLLGGSRPITREEYNQLIQGKSGKEGRAKISIARIDNPQSLTSRDKFLLEQLDLYNSQDPNRSPDPQKPEDFLYLLQEYQQTLLIRSEIARATGVPAANINQVFGTDFTTSILAGRTVETISQEIKNQIDKEREKIKKETKQRLEGEIRERVVTSTRSQLEARVRALEEELAEAEKQQPEAAGQTEAPTQENISESILRCLSGLGFTDEIKDLLKLANLPLPEGQTSSYEVLAGLQIKKAEIEAELAARADDLERLKDLRKQIAELRRLQAQKQIVQQRGQIITIEPTDNVKDVINTIEEQIKRDGLEELANIQRLLADINKKITRFSRYLEQPVKINGQRKTVREWLEEYSRLSSSKESQSGSKRNKTDIEKDLSEARLLLDYFTESEQAARKTREMDYETTEPVALAEVEALNPQLAKVIKKIDSDDNKKTMLKILQTIFGIERILPAARDDEKAVDLVNFLSKNWEQLKSITGLDAFNQAVDEIRRKVLQEVRSN